MTAPFKPIAGLILASGMSSRFGADNKLLAPLGGIPVVTRTVSAYLNAGLDDVVVVVGYDRRAVMGALDNAPVRFVFNPRYRLGQSAALQRGLRSLPPGTAAAVIGVADQPLLTGEAISALVQRFAAHREPIVAPRYAGRRGNPVLFSAELFPELQSVTGDQGGRAVIQAHAGEIGWVHLDDPSIAIDIDTPADLNTMSETRPGAEW